MVVQIEQKNSNEVFLFLCVLYVTGFGMPDFSDLLFAEVIFW